MAVQFNTWAPGQVITAEKLNQMEEHIGESNALVQTEMDNMTSMQEALGFVPEYALVTTVGGTIDAEGNYTPGAASATSPTYSNFFKVPKSGKILMSWEQNVNSGNNLITGFIWDANQNNYLGKKMYRAAADNGGSKVFPDDFTLNGSDSVIVEPGMWVRFQYPSTDTKYFVGVSFSDVYQPAYETVDEGIITAQNTADTALNSILGDMKASGEVKLSDISGNIPYGTINIVKNKNTFQVNGRIGSKAVRVPLTGTELSYASAEPNKTNQPNWYLTNIPDFIVGHSYKITIEVVSGSVTFDYPEEEFYILIGSDTGPLIDSTEIPVDGTTIVNGSTINGTVWKCLEAPTMVALVLRLGQYDNATIYASVRDITPIQEGQRAFDAVNILQRAELNPETTLFCLNYNHPKDYITGIGNTFYLNGAKTIETQGYRRIFLTDAGLIECHHEDTSSFPAEGDFTKKLTIGHKYKLTVIRKGSSVVITNGVTTTTIRDSFQIGTYNSWNSLAVLNFTEESETIQTATFVAPDAPIVINLLIRNNTFNDLQFSYWLEDVTSSVEIQGALELLQKVELNPETSTFCYHYSDTGNYVSASGNTIRLNGTIPGTTTPRNRRIFLTDNGVAECFYTDMSSYPPSTEFTRKLISGHTYKLTVLREGTPPDDTYSNNFHIGTYDNWDKPVKMYWYSYSNNIQIANFVATDDPIIINLFIRSASFNDLRYTYWLEDLSNTKTYSLKKNPYQNIPWEQIQDITSVTHAHILWEPNNGYYPQPQFEALQAKYDHLAISSYHPSAPMYPLEQHFENINSNILSSPNAEFAGFTGESSNLHLNAVGSLFSSRTGGDGGIGTLAEFVQEAEACMIGNGGIITINHPAWTVYKMNNNGTVNTTTAADMVSKIISIMDLSDRVAALEVWNASCEKNSQTGISTEIWDGVLSLGRQIYATAVPDHYVQYPAQDETAYGCGFNHMLVFNKTSEEVLAAYRTGRFYTTQYDDDLKLTYIHQNKTSGSESYNNIEIQVAAEATFLFKTATRSVEITTPATSATFTPQDGDIYVRVEAHRGNNTLWTNAIML